MKSGQIIGHYKVLRLLGKGGMGGNGIKSQGIFVESTCYFGIPISGCQWL